MYERVELQQHLCSAADVIILEMQISRHVGVLEIYSFYGNLSECKNTLAMLLVYVELDVSLCRTKSLTSDGGTF